MSNKDIRKNQSLAPPRGAAVRHLAGRTFRCVRPGLWIAYDRTVLREEFRGSTWNAGHDWVAERWGAEDWRAEEHFGVGLTFNEAAATIPEKRYG